MARSKRMLFHDVFRSALQELGFSYHQSGFFHKRSDDQGWCIVINVVVSSPGDFFDIYIDCLPYTIQDMDISRFSSHGLCSMRQLWNNTPTYPERGNYERCLDAFKQLLYRRILWIVTLQDALDFSIWLKKNCLFDFSYGLCGIYLLPEIYGYALLGKNEKASKLADYYIQGCKYALESAKENIVITQKYNLSNSQVELERKKECEQTLSEAYDMKMDLSFFDGKKLKKIAMERIERTRFSMKELDCKE